MPINSIVIDALRRRRNPSIITGPGFPWERYGQGAAGGGGDSGEEGIDLGPEGAMDMLPGEQEFYDALLARRGRSLAATARGQRRSAENAMEARGLGQSSVLGQAYSSIAQQQALGLQQAGQDISNQQFLAREARLRDALAFARQQELMKLQAALGNKGGGFWGALGTLGGALGAYFGSRGSSPEQTQT